MITYPEPLAVVLNLTTDYDPILRIAWVPVLERLGLPVLHARVRLGHLDAEGSAGNCAALGGCGLRAARDLAPHLLPVPIITKELVQGGPNHVVQLLDGGTRYRGVCCFDRHRGAGLHGRRGRHWRCRRRLGKRRRRGGSPWCWRPPSPREWHAKLPRAGCDNLLLHLLGLGRGASHGCRCWRYATHLLSSLLGLGRAASHGCRHRRCAAHLLRLGCGRTSSHNIWRDQGGTHARHRYLVVGLGLLWRLLGRS
mmetsp:Transcript_77504/g.239293  ORF Transcript_77504/g.239293 Transcript_77504/m.239293 type:complete len:253 (+) Transcript_77504:478-1236(+)